MKLADLIRRKGTTVVTVSPQATLAELTELFAEHNIGAAVVSEDGEHIVGIISERDVVRELAKAGPQITDHPVSSCATTEVFTASPEDEITEVANSMTQHRVRHLPVVVDDKLYAIVSIGDVVKFRIDQLEQERDQLIGYVQQ